jgi:hypothetical protein
MSIPQHQRRRRSTEVAMVAQVDAYAVFKKDAHTDLEVARENLRTVSLTTMLQLLPENLIVVHLAGNADALDAAVAKLSAAKGSSLVGVVKK